MIASLPMYDWPETRAATDAWWNGLARHLGPKTALIRAPDHSALWRREDLLFSQTCGFPFTHEFAGKLQLVATPHYAADGCAGPYYCSIVLARAAPIRLSDLSGTIAAVNSRDSMSGMLALKLVFTPFARKGRFFRGAIQTGGHIASMQAVRDGTADVCAIDAVCVALARRYRPDYLDGLVEVARSPSVPGLPYVTSMATESAALERLREGIAAAMADPSLAEIRAALLLSGVSALTLQDYGLIVALERECEARGGVDLI